jgi:hypothetical protein
MKNIGRRPNHLNLTGSLALTRAGHSNHLLRVRGGHSFSSSPVHFCFFSTYLSCHYLSRLLTSTIAVFTFGVPVGGSGGISQLVRSHEHFKSCFMCVDVGPDFCALILISRYYMLPRCDHSTYTNPHPSAHYPLAATREAQMRFVTW